LKKEKLKEKQCFHFERWRLFGGVAFVVERSFLFVPFCFCVFCLEVFLSLVFYVTKIFAINSARKKKKEERD